MFTINKTVLPNGLNVMLAPMHETKAVTLLILVGVGSRFETNEQAGISHFLEHMFFKGTQKRPTYKEITQELDVLGGDYNAFTSNEYTGYYVQAAADKFLVALDILSDMFFNSTFPDSEIAREQGVIIEEINMYEDQPTSKVAQEAEKLVLGKTDLGRPIIGFKETVLAITQKDLITYHNQNYQPANTFVAVAGAPLGFNWQKEIENVFGAWKQTNQPVFAKWNFNQTKSQVSVTNRATDQAHFVLTYPTFSINDPRRAVSRVMSNLLGGMMSSRLFEEIREKRGLAYYVRADVDNNHDAGSLSVSAGVVVTKIDEAISVTLQELEKLKDVMVGTDELIRSKENLKGHIYLGLEDSQSVAQYMANRMLYFGEIKQPEEIVAEIEAVTAQDIQALAQEIFVATKRNLAVIGPFEDSKRFEKIIA